MKRILDLLRILGEGLVFLLLVCLPGLIEWALSPLPDWAIAVLVVALGLGAGLYIVWRTFKNH